MDDCVLLHVNRHWPSYQSVASGLCVISIRSEYPGQKLVYDAYCSNLKT